MSANKHKPHLYVIPEDRRDEQIANGFAKHAAIKSPRQIQVSAPPGGWSFVLETFKTEYVQLLKNNGHVHVIMLIDFDGAPNDRRAKFESEIPDELRPRVFVIGPRETPEALRQALGKGYEEIGEALANDCDGNTTTTWLHEQIRHNEPERLRLLQTIRSILF